MALGWLYGCYTYYDPPYYPDFCLHVDVAGLDALVIAIGPDAAFSRANEALV